MFSSSCRSSESRGELPWRDSSGRNLSRGKRLAVEFYEGARPRARAVCQARLHAYSRGWRPMDRTERDVGWKNELVRNMLMRPLSLGHRNL